MKLGEVVVIHVYYNFTKFHQNRMKNKKVFIIDHLMEVSVGSNLVRFGGSFGFLRFGRVEVRFLGPK